MKSSKKIFILEIMILVCCIVLVIIHKLPAALCLFAVLLVLKYLTMKNTSTIRKANLAYQRRDYETAISLLKEAANDPKATAQTIGSYIFVTLKQGDKAHILEEVDELIENHPTLSEEDKNYILLYKSIGYWSNGDLNTALQLAEKIFETDKRPFTYEIYGFYLIQSGDLNKALDVNVEGSQVKGATDVIRTNLAETFYKLGQHKRSEEIFDDQIQKKIKYIEPHYYKGLLLAEEGKNSEAISTLESALFCPKSLLSGITKDMVRKAILDIDPNFQFDADEE